MCAKGAMNMSLLHDSVRQTIFAKWSNVVVCRHKVCLVSPTTGVTHMSGGLHPVNPSNPHGRADERRVGSDRGFQI